MDWRISACLTYKHAVSVLVPFTPWFPMSQFAFLANELPMLFGPDETGEVEAASDHSRASFRTPVTRKLARETCMALEASRPAHEVASVSPYSKETQ